MGANATLWDRSTAKRTAATHMLARKLLPLTAAVALARAFALPTATARLALGLFAFQLSIVPIRCASSSISHSGVMSTEDEDAVDPDYPGTAVGRLRNIHRRVRSLSAADLSGDWETVRLRILWAGGLRNLQNVPPGRGYTGHSFNDFNHVDLTPMRAQVAHSENEGRVAGIHFSNRLGPGIEAASDPDLGPGGSWSTCAIGCSREPPQDVAHLQFRSRIAFKLVWVPPHFDSFVLVDDDGALLAQVSAPPPARRLRRAHRPSPRVTGATDRPCSPRPGGARPELPHRAGQQVQPCGRRAGDHRRRRQHDDGAQPRERLTRLSTRSAHHSALCTPAPRSLHTLHAVFALFALYVTCPVGALVCNPRQAPASSSTKRPPCRVTITCTAHV